MSKTRVFSIMVLQLIMSNLTATTDSGPNSEQSTTTATVPDTAANGILYREVKAVKLGQMYRFEISYTPDTDSRLADSIWVKVKNIEPLPMRAAFLAGPYMLYVDCRSEDYKIEEKCFVTANQPSFDSQLLPGKSFLCELPCHTIKSTYKWTVDVVSQMIFNSSFDINFEITIGNSKHVLSELTCDDVGTFVPGDVLNVHHLDTYDLWNLPVPDNTKPIHLVILTHGLHSNVSADMFYLKEQIDSCNSKDGKENIVTKGFFGNICKTERGIKYLGSRCAEFIIDLVTKNEQFNNDRVTKISFVSHSLGGLVQTFTIAYLQTNFPWFFTKIRPINFIAIAAPMLGASNENPIYINLALLAGIVGKTGQDLSLRYIEDNGKPLLLLLPSGPTHQVLKKFVRRTVYSNVANDGVVPLRTSALLYLDKEGLSTVMSKESMSSHMINSEHAEKIPDDECVNPPSQSILPQPLQMIFSKFMPQKQQKVVEEDMIPDSEDNKSKNLLRRIQGFHKSSVLETAQSLILPPLPPMAYIVNPEERENTIIYDKVYYEKDLPPRDDEETDFDVDQSVNILGKQVMTSFDSQEFEKIEEVIAREYHKNMSWRKVLVRLMPDAHNNIIVRRRFANAYGWPVIQHVIDNHFNNPQEDEELINRWNLNSIGLKANDSLDDVELMGILSRDLIKRENREIEEHKNEHKWINTKDQDSFFNVGPASLINDVSEMVINLRDQWYNTQETKQQVTSVEEFDVDKERQIMGDFL